MYSEYRGEKMCCVCGEKRACCGLPATKCKECADAILSGRPDRFQSGNDRSHKCGDRDTHLSNQQYHGNGVDW